MTQTATNPKTGERVALVNGQWVPISKTATNPTTGEKVGLAGDTWVPLPKAKVVPEPTKPPVAAKKKAEERSYIADLGRAVVRGAGNIVGGLGTVVEDLPAIAASIDPYAALRNAAIGERAVKAEQEEYARRVSPVTEGLRGAGKGITESVLPRERAGVFEAYERGGVFPALASLGETVAEGALPTVAGAATAVITKNPVAAGTVMGGAVAPQTYSGIRERQKAEGVDNVGMAVAGTAASTAFDILTGTGGAASSLGREAVESIFRKGIGEATKQVARTGGSEAGTEVLQTVIEQVAGGSDPTTKASLLETLEAGLAGALGGTAFGTAFEGVEAIQRRAARKAGEDAELPEGAEPTTLTPTAPTEVTPVDVKFREFVEQDVGTRMAENPALTRSEAVKQVRAEDARRMYTDAQAVVPIYEAPTPKERKAEAKLVAEDMVRSIPGMEDAKIPAKVFNQAANQMAQRAARNELFSPQAIVTDVLAVNNIQPAVPVAPAPVVASVEVESVTPSVDEAAIAPIESVIEQVTQPTPGSVVPSLAETSAQQVGITPTPVAPIEAAPIEAASVEAAPVEAAPVEAAPVEAAPVEAVPVEVVQEVVQETAPAPEIFTDNPGGDWEASKLASTERAREEALAVGETVGSAARMLEGPATQTVRRVEIPVEKLRTLEGVQGEQPAPGQPKYDQLRQSVAETGFDREKAGLPVVYVNPEGEAFVSEGNNRIAVAAEEGVTSLPVEVQYISGAEKAPGPFAPDVLLEEHAALAPAAPAAPAAPGVTPTTPEVEALAEGAPEVVTAQAVANNITTQKIIQSVKITDAQMKSVMVKAKGKQGKLNRIQQRIARTNDGKQLITGQYEEGRVARGEKANLDLLGAIWDTMSETAQKAFLVVLPTDDIFRTVKGKLKALQRVDTLITSDIRKFKTKESFALMAESEKLGEFLRKNPKAAQAIADVQFASVAFQVDPSKARNAEAYVARFDAKSKELRKAIAQEQDIKKVKTLNTQLGNRLKEVRSVYTGGTTDEYGTVVGWNDLTKPIYGGAEAKEMFNMIKDAHRRDLEANYAALRERITDTMDEAKAEEALDKLEEKFKPAMEQAIYFPLMRFGEFYVRVGTGRESVYEMFPSSFQQMKYVRGMRRAGKEVTEYGKTGELQSRFEGEDKALKDILDSMGSGETKTVAQLRTQVFDLWMQTLTAGDMRKHLAPRKLRAGYSTDILRNFINFRHSSTGSITRAKFGYRLDTALSAARDELEGNPNSQKLKNVVQEVELRAMAELYPPRPENGFMEQAIQLGNKMAFFQYLANVKTGLIQLTQLHIVSQPMLAKRYGHAKATASLAKWGFSGLAGMAASPLKAAKRQDGEWSFDWEQPTLLDNPVSTMQKEKDPDLYDLYSRGWEEGRDRDLYQDTFANSMGFGPSDPVQTSILQDTKNWRVDRAAWRGTKFAFNAMGALMHQTERVNREATYMATLELAYRELVKKGVKHDAAVGRAIETAYETTLGATFDFTTYNKPRIVTAAGPLGGIGRVGGQFYTYPTMMISLMVRNGFTALKMAKLPPGERRAAASVFMGTTFNMMLYAGLTGVPLYGVLTGLASLLAWAFDGDDEEQGLAFVDEDGNTRWTYDVDWWFRNVWVPQFFGPEGTVANALGLEEDTAALLERSVLKGPISAGTDVDLANSIALDFMFFLPEEPRADTPELAVAEYAFNLMGGASAGVLFDYVKGGSDLLAGETERALEKLPKLVSGPIKANRFGREGQLTYDNKLIGMEADFFTNDKVLLQGLNFASTEANLRMEENYGAVKLNKEVEAKRTAVIKDLKRLVADTHVDGFTPETEAKEEELFAKINAYNTDYPFNPISQETVLEAAANTVKEIEKSRAFKGLPINEKGKTPYLEKMLERREREE